MLSEKRSFERSDTLLVVEFRSLNKTPEIHLGVTNNISRGGFSFDSQDMGLKAGEMLEFSLKDTARNLYATAKGEIVWKKDVWYNCVAGVKFHDIDIETAGRITDLMSPKKYMPSELSHLNSNTDAVLVPQDSKPASTEASSIIKAMDEIKTESNIETQKTSEPEQATQSARKDREEQIPKPVMRPVAGRGRFASVQKRKKSKYVAPVTVAAIVLAVVLYFAFNHPEEDTGNIAVKHEDAVVTGQNDKTLQLAPEDKAESGMPLQKTTEPVPLQAVPILEGKKEITEASVSRADEKVIQEDKPLPVENNEIENALLPDPGNKTVAEAETHSFSDENKVSISRDEGSGIQTAKIQDAPAEIPKENYLIYDESFTDNANNWDVFNTNMASAQIKNGEYLIENKRKAGAHIVLSNIELSHEADFTAETSFRSVKSQGDFSYGLVVNSPDRRFYGFVFGAKDALNHYSFRISEDGFYSVSRYQGGVSKELSSGKIKKAFDTQNSLSTIKIVKQGDTVRFYINDDYVDEIPAPSFYGKKSGFIIDGSLKIAVDRIHTKIR